MNERVIVVLLIAAIVLSVLSVVLTLTLDATNSASGKTTVGEEDSQSASVGLFIEGTPVSKNE